MRMRFTAQFSDTFKLFYERPVQKGVCLRSIRGAVAHVKIHDGYMVIAPIVAIKRRNAAMLKTSPS